MQKLTTATFIGAAMIAAMSFASTVDAGPPAKGPKLTGGGVIENLNSGVFGEVDIINLSGFVAMAEGVDPDIWGSNGADVWTIGVKGNVSGETSYVGDDTNNELFDKNPLATVEGSVVCMAKLALDTDPGDGDIWEVRFQITAATGYIEGVTLPVDCGGEEGPPAACYGSFYVQDNATPGAQGDLGDESFANITDPDCDLGASFGLEKVIAGNLTEHKTNTD